jgi:2-haloacid dehalogenase
VLDVLGTLVDQAGSLARELVEATGQPRDDAERVAARWLADVGEQERDVVEGRRPFAPSHALDREALGRLARDGAIDDGAIERLVSASERLRPWPDTVAGLERLAQDATLVGLSNASHRALAGLSAGSGLRWHQLVSAQDVGSYKPDPALYAAALEVAPSGAGTPVMVAAHAWDLRAAAAVGMRTAYVPRPGGDPPREGDRFDLRATDLADLHARLGTMGSAPGRGG